MTKRYGILVMAYGTPASAAEAHVRPYLEHIRHGRPVSAAAVADLQRRYEAIGGYSPLIEISARQAQGLADRLAELRPDVEWDVSLGMKHSPPFIAEGLARLAEAGPELIVLLPLAPHASRLTTEEYFAAAREAAAAAKLEAPLVPAREWHTHPRFVRAWARRVRAALEYLPPGTAVVFTAHSLPARILEWNDPYPEKIRETAEAVARAVGLADWQVAYQSASQTGEPWLGPDVLEVIEELARQGIPAVLAVPVGFVADHLEVLYDLDIEARSRAQTLGLQFGRTPSLNDDPDFLATLAEAVLRTVRTLEGE